MGDTGALALGFLLATIAVQGVLKTAATIALAGPLLVLAVPILDTSFVVLKRLKYRRAPWGADHNHFYHRFMRIGFSQRRTAAYLHLWAALLAGLRDPRALRAAAPARRLGPRHTLHRRRRRPVRVAASVWMVYTLEILKARHLQAVGLQALRRRGERPRSASRRPRTKRRSSARSRRAPQIPGSASSSRSAGSRRTRSRGAPAGFVRPARPPPGRSSSCSLPSRDELLVDARPAGPRRSTRRACRARPPRGSSCRPPRRARRRARRGCGRRRRARARSRARSPSAAIAARCSGVRGEDDGLRVLGVASSAAAAARAAAGSPSRRGRARRTAPCARRTGPSLALDPELVEHRGVGLEAGQVVLLLQARVADELRRPRAP